MFPIGNLKKDEVREIAKKQGLITAEKKDSQGLCFRGKVKITDFLQQKLVRKKGNVILISRDNDIYKKDFGYDDYAYQKEDGKIIGNHIGSHFFTIGQRKGLGVSAPHPLYVIDLDPAMNKVIVGDRDSATKMESTVKLVNWVSIAPPSTSIRAEVQVRYRSLPVAANIIPLGVNEEKPQDGFRVKLIFEEAVFGITPGQAAVWYEGDILLGGGIIENEK